MVLYQCLYDADKKPDAFKVLDTLWEKTKNKHCDFQDSLFRLRCYLCKENNAMAANIKKDIEGADPNAENSYVNYNLDDYTPDLFYDEMSGFIEKNKEL